jgi:ATP-dependent DNA helicase RecG
MELNELKGIGPKTLNLLNKLNINSINDLITHYPYRYEILKRSMK